ncbi:MAG: hypothetical protein Fur0036_09200 [Fimbriimonadaceae bacterium]
MAADPGQNMGPQEPMGHNTYASRPMKIVTITTVPTLSSRFQPVPPAICNPFNTQPLTAVPTKSLAKQSQVPGP